MIEWKECQKKDPTSIKFSFQNILNYENECWRREFNWRTLSVPHSLFLSALVKESNIKTSTQLDVYFTILSRRLCFTRENCIKLENLS